MTKIIRINGQTRILDPSTVIKIQNNQNEGRYNTVKEDGYNNAVVPIAAGLLAGDWCKRQCDFKYPWPFGKSKVKRQACKADCEGRHGTGGYSGNIPTFDGLGLGPDAPAPEGTPDPDSEKSNTGLIIGIVGGIIVLTIGTIVAVKVLKKPKIA